MKGTKPTTTLATSYNGYDGDRRWWVSHPDYQTTIMVAAPDADSAMVAAAKYWGRDWTRISFYCDARVWKA